MNWLRILLVVLVAGLFLLLSVANWTLVPFLLPDGRSVQVPLPLIIAAAFLAGWLPTWLAGAATRTMLRHRLERAERQVREVQGRPVAPPVLRDSMTGQAQPTIVPPAGA